MAFLVYKEKFYVLFLGGISCGWFDEMVLLRHWEVCHNMTSWLCNHIHCLKFRPMGHKNMTDNHIVTKQHVTYIIWKCSQMQFQYTWFQNFLGHASRPPSNYHNKVIRRINLARLSIAKWKFADQYTYSYITSEVLSLIIINLLSLALKNWRLWHWFDV